MKLRKDTLTGKIEESGWAEWSVPRLSDAHDPELWYETNPSLGTVLTERTIKSELGDDQVDDNIQRLGLWLTYNQKSAISTEEWNTCKLQKIPKLPEEKRIFYGVKYAQKTGNVSLAAAIKLDDGKVFVEAIDCRPAREGNAWIIAYLMNQNAETVAIDGAGNQTILADDMADAGVHCTALLPKVYEVIEANTLFEKQLFAEEICHSGQPSLTQAISNCEHRSIGSGGGFGYNSLIEGVDVSLVEAVSLAHWLCANAKEQTEQTISY